MRAQIYHSLLYRRSLLLCVLSLDPSRTEFISDLRLRRDVVLLETLDTPLIHSRRLLPVETPEIDIVAQASSKGISTGAGIKVPSRRLSNHSLWMDRRCPPCILLSLPTHLTSGSTENSSCETIGQIGLSSILDQTRSRSHSFTLKSEIR
ncbi:hypothetical protein K440DRAFT_354970 [Wilcoxina mikolae CBS 423.85]|nr:hypothetical protein K440DRAFT_354970 [Wilcoxina mikolae CBS 423.85]